MSEKAARALRQSLPLRDRLRAQNAVDLRALVNHRQGERRRRTRQRTLVVAEEHLSSEQIPDVPQRIDAQLFSGCEAGCPHRVDLALPCFGAQAGVGLQAVALCHVLGDLVASNPIFVVHHREPVGGGGSHEILAKLSQPLPRTAGLLH